MNKKEIKKINKKINKAIWTAYVFVCVSMMGTVLAFAKDPPADTTGGTAGSVWQTIINTICPYVVALGGVVAMIGGINWALGFKSEDSDAQVRGIRTVIAGAAVAGVVGATKGLLSIPGIIF